MVAATSVGNGNRPSAHAQTRGCATAAKVGVIEVKVKRRIEAHAMLLQGASACRSQHAVQQLHLRRGRAEIGHFALCRRTVRYGAPDVAGVPHLGIGSQPPSLLLGHAPGVTGHADYVKGA